MRFRVLAMTAAPIVAVVLALGSAEIASADHGGTHPPPTDCPYDVNRDGVVDLRDATAVVQSFGGSGTSLADVNSDGFIDHLDLQEVWDHLGGCGTITGTTSPPPGPPPQTWLLGVLDGAVNDHNREAIARGHPTF